MTQPFQCGHVVNQRYRIQKTLASHSSSYTYLAQNNENGNNYILKLFLISGDEAEKWDEISQNWQKQMALLSGFHHPQVAGIREGFCVQPEGVGVVYEDIEGVTYEELLEQKQKKEENFTESEIVQLLENILPVLQYIHTQGFIHQQICPTHLVLSDRRLMLTHLSNFQPFLSPQTYAPMGYAPMEQIEQGLVYPHSDLYSLGITLLVLLTGKPSPLLTDPSALAINWQQDLSLSPKLEQILIKLLEANPRERFSSAKAVMDTLKQTESPVYRDPSLAHPSLPPITTPEAVTQTDNLSQSNGNMTSSVSPKQNLLTGCLGKLILLLVLVVGSGTMGWFAGKAWLARIVQANDSQQTQSTSVAEKVNNSISDEELERKTEIRTLRRQMELDSRFFMALVDQQFEAQYPQQKQKLLDNTAENAPWREKWDKIALETLNKLEKLSPQTVKDLGNYNQAQLDNWKKAVNSLHLSSRALFDLADARFYVEFPHYKNQSFSNQPIGQVWQGMVLEELQRLQSGKGYEVLNLSDTQSNLQLWGKLEGGRGKAYVTRLNAGHFLSIRLNTPQNVQFSLYTPTGTYPLLEDSLQKQWSGELPETGYYELIIVATSNKATDYRLNISLKNPSF